MVEALRPRRLPLSPQVRQQVVLEVAVAGPEPHPQPARQRRQEAQRLHQGIQHQYKEIDSVPTLHRDRPLTCCRKQAFLPVRRNTAPPAFIDLLNASDGVSLCKRDLVVFSSCVFVDCDSSLTAAAVVGGCNGFCRCFIQLGVLQVLSDLLHCWCKGGWWLSKTRGCDSERMVSLLVAHRQGGGGSHLHMEHTHGGRRRGFGIASSDCT